MITNLFDHINLSKFLLDCKPFLDDMRDYYHKDSFQELYRGLEYVFDEDYMYNIFISRRNRPSLGVTKEIHIMADEMFNDKFGWNVRSEGTFATSDYNTAINYGEPYIFFPVGEYSFVYSGAIDDFIEISLDINHNIREKNISNMNKERYIREELWDNIQTYKDENLTHAIETKHEIAFKCDEYYLFKDIMLDKIIDAIYDN